MTALRFYKDWQLTESFKTGSLDKAEMVKRLLKIRYLSWNLLSAEMFLFSRSYLEMGRTVW